MVKLGPTRQYRVHRELGEESRELIRVSALSDPNEVSVDIHYRTFSVVPVCACIAVIVTAVTVVLHVSISVSVDRASRAAAIIVVSIAVSFPVAVAVTSIVLARRIVATARRW